MEVFFVLHLHRSGEHDGTPAHKDFKLLLQIAHYLAVRSACQSQPSLKVRRRGGKGISNSHIWQS